MTERVQAWRAAAFAGVTFGILYSTTMGLWQGEIPPTSVTAVKDLLLGFLGNGIFFGLLIGFFLRSPIIPKPKDIPLAPAETLVHSGLANHFLNFESRGGRLGLTSTHLRFIPHSINFQRSRLDIPIGEIAKATPVRIFKIFSNGLAVQRSSGKIEYFVVNDRLGWLDALNAAKPRSHTPGDAAGYQLRPKPGLNH